MACGWSVRRVISRLLGWWGAVGRDCAVKTFSAKPLEVERDWYLVNAPGEDPWAVGDGDRAPVAWQAQARVHAARGCTGDYIVVVNAEKDACDGQQAQGQEVPSASPGYIGNLKTLKRSTGQCSSETPEQRASRAGRQGHAAAQPAGRQMLSRSCACLQADRNTSACRHAADPLEINAWSW